MKQWTIKDFGSVCWILSFDSVSFLMDVFHFFEQIDSFCCVGNESKYRLGWGVRMVCADTVDSDDSVCLTRWKFPLAALNYLIYWTCSLILFPPPEFSCVDDDSLSICLSSGSTMIPSSAFTTTAWSTLPPSLSLTIKNSFFFPPCASIPLLYLQARYICGTLCLRQFYISQLCVWLGPSTSQAIGACELSGDQRLQFVVHIQPPLSPTVRIQHSIMNP